MYTYMYISISSPNYYERNIQQVTFFKDLCLFYLFAKKYELKFRLNDAINIKFPTP